MKELRDARVLLIGAGGLGCPAALALAARGLGHLTVLDPDRLELSNLHRQILYGESDLGHAKAPALAKSLRTRFANLDVVGLAEPFDAAHFDRLRTFDVVLDGTDQFETKLAISDACVDAGVSYVFAGVVGFEGQVLAVRPRVSACLRCFFEEAPPPGAAPTCAELGILGPVAGIVGAKQAESAVALLEGCEGVLDRLWLYEGRADRARTVELARASDCRGCGPNVHLRGARVAFEDRDLDLDAPVVDLSGRVCPETFTLTRRALENVPEHTRVWIHLTSDEAARSVPRSAIAAGHKVLAQSSDGRTHRVLIERGPTSSIPDLTNDNSELSQAGRSI